MSTLYQRLFTYRERPNRSPSEDFLTEALGDLLDRLPAPTARELVLRMIGGSADAAETLLRIWGDGDVARWTTQRTIPGGRLDLLLEIAGTPAVVVEVKLAAGFQSHAIEGPQDEARHQLRTYGDWLRGQADPEWGGALVLLTHWTAPPDDFLRHPERYGAQRTGVFRWSDLHRWLVKQVRATWPNDSGWTTLAAEFTAFLKEKGMDSELATNADVAALQIYLSSADRIRNTVELIWNGAQELWRPLCINRDTPLELSTAYGCAWKWRYLAREDLRQSFIAAGVRWPDIADDATYSDRDGEPHLFVELGSDEDASPISRLILPKEWLGSGDSRIARLPLRALPTGADAFRLEAQDWVRARIVEVVDLLR